MLYHRPEKDEWREKDRAKAAGNPFFHRLRPPDEHPKIRRFKSVDGETRQDLKIPVISRRRLPRALSCSDPAAYRIPVRLSPFGKRGAFS